MFSSWCASTINWLLMAVYVTSQLGFGHSKSRTPKLWNMFLGSREFEDPIVWNVGKGTPTRDLVEIVSADIVYWFATESDWKFVICFTPFCFCVTACQSEGCWSLYVPTTISLIRVEVNQKIVAQDGVVAATFFNQEVFDLSIIHPDIRWIPIFLIL